MNILDTIIEYKKTEVRRRKSEVPGIELTKSKFFEKQTLSLKSFLLDTTSTGIIAEFKRRSPSKDAINAEADVSKITTGYTKHGASGLSVLTDEKFFGGSTGDLAKARTNKIPILRKDFIIDEYQVIETKSMGADVILLIADVLSQNVTKRLAAFARSLGLEVLLEVHNEKDLDHISNEVDIVGVNNRDLKTFKVDINTSLKLIKRITTSKLAISESGINAVETIVTLRQAGFRGFLIGEAFMNNPDPTIAFADFVKQLKAKQ